MEHCRSISVSFSANLSIIIASVVSQMESMEDSGFDSDHKTSQQNISEVPEVETSPMRGNTANHFKNLKRTSELQKKLQRQREVNIKSQNSSAASIHQIKSLLPRNRLLIPGKNEFFSVNQHEPLVAIMSDDDSDDEEEDDFSLSKKAATKEITQQLIKDGYNLDLEPDDEDLDLIPPRPLNERCVCCQMQATCALQ